MKKDQLHHNHTKKPLKQYFCLQTSRDNVLLRILICFISITGDSEEDESYPLELSQSHVHFHGSDLT